MSDYIKAFERMTDDSGQGSALEFTKPYREFLDWFIHEHQIARIVDLGCGDLRVWDGAFLNDTIQRGTSYFGIDVLPERIKRNECDTTLIRAHDATFQCANILETGPWYGGLIHCKDVLQHWPIADIWKFIEILEKSYFRFALITNCNYKTEDVNSDIELGAWRPLDLTIEPFFTGRKVFSWGDPNKDVVLIEP